MTSPPKVRSRAATPQPEPTRGRNTTVIAVVAVAVAVVVIAAVVALLATGGDDGGGEAGGGAAIDLDQVVAETQSVQVGGEALPELPQGGADPAVGMAAPTLTGADFAGDEVVVGEPGSPTLVVFLAHWCPHCQAEVPVIQSLIDEGAVPEGVEVAGVATSTSEDQPNYPPSRWLADEGWSSDVLADDTTGEAARAYGVSGFPFFVAVDAEGRVVQRGSGELGRDAILDLLGAIAPAGGDAG